MKYDFLALSLLCSIPGAIVFATRRDLRRVVLVTAACSLPFAVTERFFYGDYWRPTFLFDLVHVLGFGIEDVLQVTATAAYTTTAYPFVFRRGLEPVPGEPSGAADVARRAAGLVAVMLGVALALYGALRLPMIHASFFAMTFAAAIMLVRRRDLVVPSLLGAGVSSATYAIVCLVYAWLLPGVFERVWIADRLLVGKQYVLGIPLEELLYALTCGVAAQAFYPFVTRTRFAPLRLS